MKNRINFTNSDSSSIDENITTFSVSSNINTTGTVSMNIPSYQIQQTHKSECEMKGCKEKVSLMKRYCPRCQLIKRLKEEYHNGELDEIFEDAFGGLESEIIKDKIKRIEDDNLQKE